MQDLYAQASELIRKSPKPLVFTGAGMSKESGIPLSAMRWMAWLGSRP